MKDTFGMALMDYFDNPESIHVLERDDGYLNTIQTSDYFREFTEWSQLEQELVKHAKGCVLDVGCGSGRVVKYLQEKGLKVLGIDISELAIEASKKFGVKDCMLMDVMDLKFNKESFDSVLLLGNGFGLCGYENSKKMLENLSEITENNGILLATSRDPKKTDNPKHFAYHQKNRENGRPIGLVNLRVNFGEEKGEWFEFYMPEPKDIESFIENTGWILEKLVKADAPEYPIYGVFLRKLMKSQH